MRFRFKKNRKLYKPKIPQCKENSSSLDNKANKHMRADEPLLIHMKDCRSSTSESTQAIKDNARPTKRQVNNEYKYLYRNLMSYPSVFLNLTQYQTYKCVLFFLCRDLKPENILLDDRGMSQSFFFPVQTRMG